MSCRWRCLTSPVSLRPARQPRGRRPRRRRLLASSNQGQVAGGRGQLPSIAFYISGHGFGHASRQVEIINAFARRRPDIRILVRSTAARWLLERTIAAPFTLDDTATDTGVIQIDSLHLDAA